jgi:chemotaxis signal transduction protein
MQDNHQSLDAIEVLAFTLGQEEYGLSILKVQEIRGYKNWQHRK